MHSPRRPYHSRHYTTRLEGVALVGLRRVPCTHLAANATTGSIQVVRRFLLFTDILVTADFRTKFVAATSNEYRASCFVLDYLDDNACCSRSGGVYSGRLRKTFWDVHILIQS